ncbi:hypothetical protein [Pseudoalteromonas phage vB_PalP_Y7]|nr:hypothetical protein [Pseudoalteromonas phage vB_PalP_Y7]
MSLLTPARYPAKIYSHTDEDAPQLANADGVIKTILKACLVTGYGTKAAAGWTMLFDDATRIVLRAPEAGQALGMPDIKIENGAGKYRIVSQSDPSGLDDPQELSSTPLLSKDSSLRPVWRLVASDVGFVFWYGMAENGWAWGTPKGTMLGCFFNKSLLASGENIPVIFHPNANISASTGIGNSNWLLSTPCKNAVSNSVLPNPSFLRSIVTDPLVDIYQFAIAGNTLVMGVLYSLSGTVRADEAVIINSDQRYLRVCTFGEMSQYKIEYYIPIDYWEL